MTPGIRPPHLRWAAIALVALGGTVGVAAREVLTLIVPTLGALPLAIAIVNLFGAFLLGLLYEALTRADPTRSTARSLRLLLGTGFCGGFTTYSALAVDTALLLGDGELATAAAYALGTVVLGACATWGGIAIGHAIATRMPQTSAQQGATS
ncbi:CrcB protein [Microterricola gilva]|uniref:Fluoride-specific ion channel FluC n=1 Tax=Microterricola gilva TaxID=393267 RepID=A0A4Q8AMD4_9MICO|nr:CrcB family protein [Microterricola gilva]RZU65668.1 CrcB protein [Microterricola gilva]